MTAAVTCQRTHILLEIVARSVKGDRIDNTAEHIQAVGDHRVQQVKDSEGMVVRRSTHCLLNDSKARRGQAVTGMTTRWSAYKLAKITQYTVR